MTLGEYIAAYRARQGISQRKFADIVGVSNGYISMLEKNENPTTQKPITISMPVLKKIANAMGLTFSELVSQVDDIPIDLGPAEKPKKEKIKQIETLLDTASPEQMNAVLAFIRMMMSEDQTTM